MHKIQEHKAVEEEHTQGQKACDLPEDFTLQGNLLDADADIQGMPAPRLSKFRIELAPPGSCDPVSFKQPSTTEQQHRDPDGILPFVHLLCLCAATPSSAVAKLLLIVALSY